MGAIYKNAPLVNTAFEIRFPGEVGIETRRDQFQAAVRSDFPNLWVPNAVPNISPALQHYQFRTEDNSARVSLAINSFVYATSTYPGFEQFRTNLERQRAIFDEVFEISSYTRLGLRYTNQLPILRTENNFIPLANYVSARIDVGGRFPTPDINELQFSMSCKTDTGDLRVTIQNEDRSSIEVLTIDLDFFLNGKIGKDQIPGFLINAHDKIEAVFLSLISDDYKSIMKGD